MNSLKQYIIEKFKLNAKNIKTKPIYKYHPKDRDELLRLVDKLIRENGNDIDLNDIDTSKVENMSWLFNGFKRSHFNGDISKWNVSNVNSMVGMFADSEFNGDISKWDVSNVEYMSNMFDGSNFNRKEDLENWKLNKIKDMEHIFDNCPLEKNPPSWYHE